MAASYDLASLDHRAFEVFEQSYPIIGLVRNWLIYVLGPFRSESLR